MLASEQMINFLKMKYRQKFWQKHMTYIFLHAIECRLYGEASRNYTLKIIRISDPIWSIISIRSNSAFVEISRCNLKDFLYI
jgi:hypothetical protein